MAGPSNLKKWLLGFTVNKGFTKKMFFSDNNDNVLKEMPYVKIQIPKSRDSKLAA